MMAVAAFTSDEYNVAIARLRLILIGHDNYEHPSVATAIDTFIDTAKEHNFTPSSIVRLVLISAARGHRGRVGGYGVQPGDVAAYVQEQSRYAFNMEQQEDISGAEMVKILTQSLGSVESYSDIVRKIAEIKMSSL